ncbi:hypothetical protein [[Limnothrix rosea] IAM M-220]|uniref:hypothetical protein n=1 Tax=[Limnothrix rosea] IAM M-220 TaxID=454133 RepID=UPI0009684202|nr:hypothetical protein [[Limnothrix rosea] IAM M-220]OKH11757.1 hypothetical protein NIES208_16865 [[Limnothrix rosea] IAM M-220]
MTKIQKISQLTPDQEDQLSHYQKKWRNLIFPTASATETEMRAAVGQAYEYLNLPSPEIYIFESLFDVPDVCWSNSPWQNPGNAISLQQTLLQPLISIAASQVGGRLWGKLWNIAPRQDYTPLYPKGWSQRARKKIWMDDFFRDPFGLRHCGRVDFCQGVLGCALDTDAWDTLYGLIQLGGWLFPHEHLCIAIQKRLINATGSSLGSENLALVNGLTQVESQILVRLQLAPLEAAAGRPKQAFDQWADLVAVAQGQLSGIVRDRTLLAIVQQARSITTCTDMDEYPFIYGATSPFASQVWEKCREIVQLIETPELKMKAQSVLPAT